MKRNKPIPKALLERTEEQVRRLQEQLLEQLESGARQCVEVERRLAGCGSPETELLIKLHRALVLRCTLDPAGAEEMVKMTRDLMRPIMEWARLEEKRREREEAQAAQRKDEQTGELKPETLEKIDRRLNLL